MSTTTAPHLGSGPLAQIERLVQEQAKRLAIDATGPDGIARIKALVEEEVERWNLDHRRGRNTAEIADPATLAERALRNLTGYGPLQPLLEDPDVWEIMVNSPTAIFVKRHRGRSGFHSEVFHDDDHVERTITKILEDASGSHRTLDPAEGLQDAQLLDGSRLHIVHRDLARGGHLVVNIRKFTSVPIRTLDQLVELGTLDRTTAEFLRACVKARLSVVFAGAPGSGKTTLLGCCLAELDPALRVVVAEEVFEHDLPLPNVAQMQTRAARADRPAIDLRRLVAGFLRMAADVSVVGEVRDREALPLLLALSSGVTGYTTIHAASARQALTRLRFVCQLAEQGSPIPLHALNSLVSEAIDVVVHSTRTPLGVRVDEIVAVEDLAGPSDATQFTVTELFRRRAMSEPLAWTGVVPVRSQAAFAAAGIDVARLLERGAPR